MNGLRALIFDVQGTTTDFRSTLVAAAERLASGRTPGVDWGKFVDRWRSLYRPALDDVLAGRDAWRPVDTIYREALDRLLAEFGIECFSEADRCELNGTWQRLIPWPDSLEGLKRLRARYTIVTLSNADTCAVVNLSKAAGLPWDAVFSAEMVGTFKPDPRTYRMALRYLGVEADQAMMVACHKYDLHAARALGLRTAFVARPLEFGVGVAVDTAFEDAFDINARDFVDLAEQLGCKPVAESY